MATDYVRGMLHRLSNVNLYNNDPENPALIQSMFRSVYENVPQISGDMSKPDGVKLIADEAYRAASEIKDQAELREHEAGDSLYFNRFIHAVPVGSWIATFAAYVGATANDWGSNDAGLNFRNVAMCVGAVGTAAHGVGTYVLHLFQQRQIQKHMKNAQVAESEVNITAQQVERAKFLKKSQALADRCVRETNFDELVGMHRIFDADMHRCPPGVVPIELAKEWTKIGVMMKLLPYIYPQGQNKESATILREAVRSPSPSSYDAHSPPVEDPLSSPTLPGFPTRVHASRFQGFGLAKEYKSAKDVLNHEICYVLSPMIIRYIQKLHDDSGLSKSEELQAVENENAKDTKLAVSKLHQEKNQNNLLAQKLLKQKEGSHLASPVWHITPIVGYTYTVTILGLNFLDNWGTSGIGSKIAEAGALVACGMTGISAVWLYYKSRMQHEIIKERGLEAQDARVVFELSENHIARAELLLKAHDAKKECLKASTLEEMREIYHKFNLILHQEKTENVPIRLLTYWTKIGALIELLPKISPGIKNAEDSKDIPLRSSTSSSSSVPLSRMRLRRPSPAFEVVATVPAHFVLPHTQFNSKFQLESDSDDFDIELQPGEGALKTIKLEIKRVMGYIIQRHVKALTREVDKLRMGSDLKISVDKTPPKINEENTKKDDGERPQSSPSPKLEEITVDRGES